MTPEYLTRELIINPESFTRLCADASTIRATEVDNIAYSLSLILACGTYTAQVRKILFGDSDEAKALTGSEVITALLISAEKIFKEFDTDDYDRRVATAGFMLMHALDVLEKAFGSDRDEHNPREEESK